MDELQTETAWRAYSELGMTVVVILVTFVLGSGRRGTIGAGAGAGVDWLADSAAFPAGVLLALAVVFLPAPPSPAAYAPGPTSAAPPRSTAIPRSPVARTLARPRAASRPDGRPLQAHRPTHAPRAAGCALIP